MSKKPEKLELGHPDINESESVGLRGNQLEVFGEALYGIVRLLSLG